MSDPGFAHLAELHQLGDTPIPPVVRRLAGVAEPDLVWRNDLGGLTFRVADGYLKWNPRSTGIDLERERIRLVWLVERHPAPIVLDHDAGRCADLDDAKARLGLD